FHTCQRPPRRLKSLQLPCTCIRSPLNLSMAKTARRIVRCSAALTAARLPDVNPKRHHSDDRTAQRCESADKSAILKGQMRDLPQDRRGERDAGPVNRDHRRYVTTTLALIPSVFRRARARSASSREPYGPTRTRKRAPSVVSC